MNSDSMMQTTIKDRRTGRRGGVVPESGVAESFKRASAANSAPRFYHAQPAVAQPLRPVTLCPLLQAELDDRIRHRSDGLRALHRGRVAPVRLHPAHRRLV